MPSAITRDVDSNHPAPAPAQSAPSVRLLSLVRGLIAYGIELVAALRSNPSASLLFDSSFTFGTHDIAQIIARITRGLRIAAALEQRLQHDAARLDQEPVPARMTATPRAPHPDRLTPSRCKDFAAAVDRLPPAADIAAMLRRRPIGAVFADLANELGITIMHPLWSELQDAVLYYGGSLARMSAPSCKGFAARWKAAIRPGEQAAHMSAEAKPQAPPPALSTPPAEATGTGPPGRKAA